MPRRRHRTTNRVPQEERRLRVRTQRHQSPDPKKLSRAFVALAIARAEAEAQAAGNDSERDGNTVKKASQGGTAPKSAQQSSRKRLPSRENEEAADDRS